MTKLEKFQNIKREFGIKFAIKYYFFRETNQYGKYITLVYEYLNTYLADVVKSYSMYSSKDKEEMEIAKDIWVCWWQGENDMPEFCQMCYENLCYNTPENYTVHLITKDNYDEYATIPDYVIKKMQHGIISITQFSDVLRQSLLYYNGGVWIDASIWVTENYLSRINTEASFWSIKLRKIDDWSIPGQLISECKWGGFILAGRKGDLIFKYVFESMCKYYKEHNSTIDYFIHNMIIRIGYEHIKLIREEIDKVEYSNLHLYELYKYMDQPFDKNIWNELCSDTSIFKLSQKKQYHEIINETQTFFWYIKSTNERQKCDVQYET